MGIHWFRIGDLIIKIFVNISDVCLQCVVKSYHMTVYEEITYCLSKHNFKHRQFSDSKFSLSLVVEMTKTVTRFSKEIKVFGNVKNLSAKYLKRKSMSERSKHA